LTSLGEHLIYKGRVKLRHWPDANCVAHRPCCTGLHVCTIIL